MSAPKPEGLPEQPTPGALLDSFLAPEEYQPPRTGVAQLNFGGGISSISPLSKLSILMPAYNEEATILGAVSRVLRVNYPCDFELIVVDDGSTDSTGPLLNKIQDDHLIVVRHPANRGKGAALLSGAAIATGTHLLPFDADLEYDAEDIPRMLEPVLRNRCAIVYGVRLPGRNTGYRSFRYVAGNRLLTRMANILFDANINDLHTCLKLMPLTLVRGLNLTEEGFGLDTELTALLLRRGLRPFEVPVSYYGRSHAEGKKINWRDAAACMWILLRVRLQSGDRCATAGASDSGARTDSASPNQPAPRRRFVLQVDNPIGPEDVSIRQPGRISRHAK